MTVELAAETERTAAAGVAYPPDQPAEIREAERLHERLVARALEMDGTCTGEHGVGLGKRRFLAAEHGAGLELRRAVKAALDPQNLMNPGKIL